MDCSCSKSAVQPQLNAWAVFRPMDCSCSKSAVQPQHARASTVAAAIVAVQNPQSSRNNRVRLIVSGNIVAVQNPQSSRNKLRPHLPPA